MRCNPYFLLIDFVVALFHEVLNVLFPVPEPGAGHAQEGFGGLGVRVLQWNVGLVVGKGIEGPVDVWIDSHDERGIKLDLLKLLSVSTVAATGEVLRQLLDTILKKLALPLPLRLVAG